MDHSNEHGAASSAAGYLFQARYSLLLGLQAIASTPQLSISIEKFDDISFQDNGSPVQLIQTKHHIATKGDLTDSSSDLWKTLRIWIKHLKDDIDASFRQRFVLLTTGEAPAESASSYLRMRERNESKADSILLKAAATSKNKDHQDVYQAYRDLPEAQRLNFLKSVYILDSSPNIIDVQEDIANELRHAVNKNKILFFVERLEGWWFNLVVKALCNSSEIPVMAIDNRLDELREEFRRDSLPVDYAQVSPSPEIVADLDKRLFVHQLRKIEVGEKRIEYAIRDFYRASEQRSKWVREDLLVDGELGKYDNELKEAWEPRFFSAVDELPSVCSHDEKVKAGQGVFKWVETEASFSFRSVKDRFLTHGSFHILSNRRVIGWHPDYESSTPRGSSEEGGE